MCKILKWKGKEFCPNMEILTTSLSRKLIKLVKETSQLRQDYLRLTLKWVEESVALYETGMQLQSERMELCQATQLTDQTRREKNWVCDELDMRNKAFQFDRARNWQEIEEFRRFCFTEAERARQLRSDELSTQKEENNSTVNQVLVQIHELQDKVTSLNDAKEFSDPETASSSGLSHVPSQPMSIPSPRGMLGRDSCLQLDTRNSLGTSGHVFEGLLARGEPSAALFENSKNLASYSCRLKPIDARKVAEHGEGLRKEPQNHTIPTPRFATKFSTWNPLYRTGGTYPKKMHDRKSEEPDLGPATRKIPWLLRLPVLERPISRLKYALIQDVLLSQCFGSKKWRWPDQWTISWRHSQKKGVTLLISKCWMRR